MSSKNIEAAYPLSPMQHGMLFHTLYEPESGMYFEQLSCTLDGNLNVLAFQQAWQQVVDRHPVLRTAFVWNKIEKPLQVVGRRVGNSTTGGVCRQWISKRNWRCSFKQTGSKASNCLRLH
jgi:hypothetical protein